MSDYERMTTAQSIRALSIKADGLQRELAALRLDVRRLVLLLERQYARAAVPGQPSLEDVKPVPKVRCRSEGVR